MRWSQLLLSGKRGSLDELCGYELLLRAGFLRKIAAGVFEWDVLGVWLMEEIDNWLHAKFRCPPTTTFLRPYPFEPYKKQTNSPQPSTSAHVTPRTWYAPSLLAATTAHISSYKQLPQHVLTQNAVYRPELRARSGPLRAYMFHVIEGISLAHNLMTAHEAHALWQNVWEELFARAQLEIKQARRGDATGSERIAYIWPHEGADTYFLHCSMCGTWYHPDTAPFAHEHVPPETHRPRRLVETPGATTIEKLCAQLNIAPEKVLKTIFLVASHTLPVIAVVRGDMELSETKLRRILGPVEVRPATPQEIKELGAEAGYGSPIGIQGALVITDAAAMLGTNMVAGANKQNYHFLNVNPGRDFQPHIIADIARAPLESRCPACHRSYKPVRAWTIASVTLPLHPEQQLLIPPPDFMPTLKDLHFPFPLPEYVDDQGTRKKPWLVRSVLGLERLITAVAETHHDTSGLKWPPDFAPFDVHLVRIARKKDAAVVETADEIYARLKTHFRVLYDDRDESGGVKLKDADLIGAPIQVVVSSRTLKQSSVEVKSRGGEAFLISVPDIVSTIEQMLSTPAD